MPVNRCPALPSASGACHEVLGFESCIGQPGSRFGAWLFGQRMNVVEDEDLKARVSAVQVSLDSCTHYKELVQGVEYRRRILITPSLMCNSYHDTLRA